MDQSTLPGEKGSLKSANALADNDVFGRDEICQMHMLMVLLSCLPPNGKVCEMIELALTLPHEPCLARVNPLSDTSFPGLKTWLESFWNQEELTPDEQKLIAWQRSNENMTAVVQELKEAEQQIGLKLALQQMA